MGGSSSKKQAPTKSKSPASGDVISKKSNILLVQDSEPVHVQPNESHDAHVQPVESPDAHVTDSRELYDDVEDMVAPETPPSHDPVTSTKTISFDQDPGFPDATMIESFSRENTFSSPTTSPFKSPLDHSTRPPLKFDQTNTNSLPTQTTIHRQPPQPASGGGVLPSANFVTSSGLVTSSNTGQINLNQSTRHFSSGMVLGDTGGGYSKSQNFYGKQRDLSGRYNSYSGVENHTPSHFSGVYNRHVTDQKSHVTDQKQSRDNNSDVASLLRKDKFSLLGSQLQQQESKIFSRNTQPTNGLTNGLSAKPSSMAPSSTISKFDPNKFRKVNEVSSGNMTSFGGFSGSGGGFSSSRNGGVKKAGLGVSGPLDDRDEELIASIEREFDFSC